MAYVLQPESVSRTVAEFEVSVYRAGHLLSGAVSGVYLYPYEGHPDARWRVAASVEGTSARSAWNPRFASRADAEQFRDAALVALTRAS